MSLLIKFVVYGFSIIACLFLVIVGIWLIYRTIGYLALVGWHARMWRKTRKWRKNPKEKDRCYFINVMDKWTMCTVIAGPVIQDGVKKVRVQSDGQSYSLQWMPVTHLHYLSPEDREIISGIRLRKHAKDLQAKGWL